MPRRARALASHGRRRRPLSAQHGRGAVPPAAGAAARHRRRWRPRSSAARRSTTRRRKATTTSSARCTSRCAAPTPTRRSIGWPACWPAARTRSTSRAAWCASPSRISAWPIPMRCRRRSPPGTPTSGWARPKASSRIAQCVVYLGTAPKSNAAYRAFGAARSAAEETGSLMPPKHILNAPTRLMKQLGYGKGYEYDHDAPRGLLGPELLPRRHGAAANSTARSSAASSARSASGSTIGRSSGPSGPRHDLRGSHGSLARTHWLASCRCG